MDQILDTPEVDFKRFNYAGFWIRVAALLLDGIVLVFLILFMDFIFNRLKAEHTVIPLLNLIAILLYYTICESSRWQGTLGKMLAGIKVGNENGSQISFFRAFIRFIAKWISAIPIFIGYMMAGWDVKKQSLHDRIASTYVFYIDNVD